MFRDMRRCWHLRLQIASLEYHHQLSKKKVSEALEEPEKLSVRDALGIVMITHGEEIGEESAFGTFAFLFAKGGLLLEHELHTHALLLLLPPGVGMTMTVVVVCGLSTCVQVRP